jgi:hypothetical protein
MTAHDPGNISTANFTHIPRRIPVTELKRLAWVKSSRSTPNGCVEVALVDDGIAVRDSKLGDDSPVLRFTPYEWDLFVLAVKDGEFDHTVSHSAPGVLA